MFNWLKQLFAESEDAKLKRLVASHSSSVSEIARLVAKDLRFRTSRPYFLRILRRLKGGCSSPPNCMQLHGNDMRWLQLTCWHVLPYGRRFG